jgi:hypothetical protein
MEHETREHSQSWSHTGRAASPHSPAGGGGPGRFRGPGPILKSTPQPQTGHKHLDIPHPGSPASRQFQWGDALLDVGLTLPGGGKSLLLWVFSHVKKVDQPFATALLRHYVEGTGEPLDLNEIGTIPEDWQAWIVKETNGKPLRKALSLSPYNAKPPIPDLKNSLGHFDVVVTAKKRTRVKIYDIEKNPYYFAFKPHDTSRTGQHGFELRSLSDDDIRQIQAWLPTRQYMNPGGFEEGFEIRRVGGVWTLFVPYQVLVETGKPFRVYGKFER